MKTIQMTQKAFGDNVMRAAQIKVWHKYFTDGQESVDSDPRSGRTATSRTPENVERVRAAVNKGWRLTVRDPEADLGIPKTSMSEVLMQDPGMKCCLEIFVPRLLLPEQKDHHAAVASDAGRTV